MKENQNCALMSVITLHSFAASPFGEKVRLILSLKGLQWQSVDAELILPKPGLSALTGGYRKTPVLQIGADVYCDSRLIAEELETRYPEPTLFPGNSKGLCLALSSWSDRDFHIASSGLAIGVNLKQFPPDLMADRAKFFEGFMDMGLLEKDVPYLKSQLCAHAHIIEEQLGDGRLFWLGAQPSLADFHAYVEIWTARGHLPFAQALLQRYNKMSLWEDRIRAIYDGTTQIVNISEAHELARHSTPLPGLGVDTEDASEFLSGDNVVVTPEDYGREPTIGRLVTLNPREVAVMRDDPIVGQVTVHFPRIGYRICRHPEPVN